MLQAGTGVISLRNSQWFARPVGSVVTFSLPTETILAHDLTIDTGFGGIIRFGGHSLTTWSALVSASGNAICLSALGF